MYAEKISVSHKLCSGVKMQMKCMKFKAVRSNTIINGS